MRDPLAEMSNSGITVMLDDACRQCDEKTLVVLGIARGGTSAVAGALDRMGIFTGALSAGPVFEDVNLANAIESGTPRDAQEIIDQYNAAHRLWAYKRPRLLYHIQDVHSLFRNPIYLVVFRDVFAAAQRTAISGGVNIHLTMKKLLGDAERILTFVTAEQPNAVLLSYEKLVANPGPLLAQVANELQLGVTDTQLQAAVEFIRPAPEDYLDATRTNKASGQVCGISHNRVQGWAKYNFPLKPAATLELSVNGSVVATTVADRAATELSPCEQQGGELPTDSGCAFLFELAEHSICDGDRISVRASEDIADLDNCPLQAELAGRKRSPLDFLARLARRAVRNQGKPT